MEKTYEHREDITWDDGITEVVSIKRTKDGPRLYPDGQINPYTFVNGRTLSAQQATKLADVLTTYAKASIEIDGAKNRLQDAFPGGVELSEIWHHCDENADLFGEAMRTLRTDEKPVPETWFFDCNGEHFSIKKGEEVRIFKPEKV